MKHGVHSFDKKSYQGPLIKFEKEIIARKRQWGGKAIDRENISFSISQLIVTFVKVRFAMLKINAPYHATEETADTWRQFQVFWLIYSQIRWIHKINYLRIKIFKNNKQRMTINLFCVNAFFAFFTNCLKHVAIQQIFINNKWIIYKYRP